MFGFFSQNNTIDSNTEYGLWALGFATLGATLAFFIAVYNLTKTVMAENHNFGAGIPPFPHTFIMERSSAPPDPPTHYHDYP